MTTLADAVGVGVVNQKLSFRYDHLGRRIPEARAEPDRGTDTCRRYLYEGWNLVAEFDATESACGALVRRLFLGPGSDRLLHRQGGGVGALLQIADNVAGTVGLAARDGNGNVVALINPDSSSAPVAAAYEYSPFGEILARRRLHGEGQSIPVQQQVHGRRVGPDLLRPPLLQS
jgi:hypothetical protein